jgi:multidrug resistance efflux pump
MAAAPLIVCLGAGAAAVWLYRETPGRGGIPAIAEVKQYTVSSLETGRLASVDVLLGQRVEKGQVLATLERDLLAQEISVAAAQLRELESDVGAQGKTLDLSGLETDRTFQADLEKLEFELSQTRAECERNQAEMKGTDEELVRQRELVKGRLVSADRLHELQMTMSALQQTAASCPERLKVLESSKKAARARLEGWMLNLRGGARGMTPAANAQLQPLELRSRRQREYLRLLQMRLENMVVRAPVNGHVVRIDTMPGAILIPGNPVMILVEDDPHQVIAYLEENRGYGVRVGERTVLRPRDRGGPAIEGVVAALGGAVTEMPQRFWQTSNRPRWGREVFIQVAAGHSLAPGEAFQADFDPDRQSLGIERPVAASSPPAIPDLGRAATPLVAPAALLARSRFEPSGIAWIDAWQRYLLVSDDTGLESANDNASWVFLLSRNGSVDPTPVLMEGLDRVSDLESLAAAPDGRIYFLASQSLNRQGKRPRIRTLLIGARLDGKKLRVDGVMSFYDSLLHATDADPSLLPALGLRARFGDEPEIEIEGLAWKDNTLFMGLKNPQDAQGRALIWRLEDPAAVIRRGSLSRADLKLWQKAWLPVEGTAGGISELLFLPDGSLMLAATNDRGGALFQGRQSGGELRIQQVRRFPGMKPEGLCLSPDGGIVVVFDQQQKTPLWSRLELQR